MGQTQENQSNRAGRNLANMGRLRRPNADKSAQVEKTRRVWKQREASVGYSKTCTLNRITPERVPGIASTSSAAQS